MKKYLIAHDLGTYRNKALLLSTDGEIVSRCSLGYPIDMVYPNWIEQNPEFWWDAICACNEELLKKVDPRDVAGISITGQMMCCLPVDQRGKALSPAIIWSDSRAIEQAARLERRMGREKYFETVGMRSWPNNSLPKMMWIKEKKPALYRAAFKFLTAKDYVIYRLTGSFITDTENGAYTNCMDWRSRTWSADVMQASGVDMEKLPELSEPTKVVGEVTIQAAKECGLPAGTPVVLGIGDGGSATLGTGITETGDAYTCLGNSGWVSVLTESQKLDEERKIFKLNYFGQYRDSGAMQSAGISYKWLRDNLCSTEIELSKETGQRDFALIDILAKQSAPGANGVIFLPHLLGERSPLWDSKLHASFLGITVATERADLCRSVLEGVALNLNHILSVILKLNNLSGLKNMRFMGGGSVSRLWQQILADVYNVPVETMKYSSEAGALGAAVILGVGIGEFKDIRVIHEIQKSETIAYPDPDRAGFYHQLYDTFLYAEKALRQVNHRLSDLLTNSQ